MEGTSRAWEGWRRVRPRYLFGWLLSCGFLCCCCPSTKDHRRPLFWVLRTFLSSYPLGPRGSQRGTDDVLRASWLSLTLLTPVWIHPLADFPQLPHLQCHLFLARILRVQRLYIHFFMVILILDANRRTALRHFSLSLFTRALNHPIRAKICQVILKRLASLWQNHAAT